MANFIPLANGASQGNYFLPKSHKLAVFGEKKAYKNISGSCLGATLLFQSHTHFSLGINIFCCLQTELFIFPLLAYSLKFALLVHFFDLWKNLEIKNPVFKQVANVISWIWPPRLDSNIKNVSFCLYDVFETITQTVRSKHDFYGRYKSPSVAAFF